MTGTFVAIVGPSGAGKDSVMAEACRMRPDIGMVRRVISRQATDNTEEFEPASFKEMKTRHDAGGFALFWEAHGLCYAIPADVEAELACGRHMLANLSRRVVAQARVRFQPCLTVLITAPEDVLAERLAARGRETDDDIAGRLLRAADPSPEGVDLTIENISTVTDAAEKLIAALPQPFNANL